jgi:hypothetical protein
MATNDKKRKRVQQWVFILPESDQAGPADELTIVTFKNPGTGALRSCNFAVVAALSCISMSSVGCCHLHQ